MAEENAALEPWVDDYYSALLDEYLPSHRSDQTKDNNDYSKVQDHQVEEEYFPGVKYLNDDNDRNYPAYEKQPWELPPFPHPCLFPRPDQFFIHNMADLRREAASGEPILELVVQDIDYEGWAAGFEDMAKLLKWGDRFRFNTPEHFDGWCEFFHCCFSSIAPAGNGSHFELIDLTHSSTFPCPRENAIERDWL